MKCLLLAGGRGDRLWPLSRKNYPKQFIEIKNNHSIFQETVARNMAFCDEFIIVSNKEYQNIIENQMKAFRGLTYRCIYEEVGRKTTAAIVLACRQLPLSELLFVVASDHLIEGESYKDDILRARELAKQGYLVTFGMDIKKPDTRYGYIRFNGDNVIDFTEKPDEETAKMYQKSGNYYINSGMFLFRNGDFLRELKTSSPYVASIFESCYYMRRVEGSNVYYNADVMESIPALPIEKTVFEKTKKAKVIHSLFKWQDLGSLDDLDTIWIQGSTEEQVISNKCENTTVINQSSKKLVLVNHLENILVVNTDDAIYIGNKGDANDLKEIIRASQSMWGYFDKSSLFFRNWGKYEILEENLYQGYQVRKVTVLPGKTIYAHLHEKRTENWYIINGRARVLIDGIEQEKGVGDTVLIPAGIQHQISAVSDEPLCFIETVTGCLSQNEDLIHIDSKDLSDVSLGFEVEPFVKLSPAYKDYLWGGTKLREQFSKQCEYEVIAESWELSAHPDGQCIVASGKYKGLLFGEFLKKIGSESLGWKYQSFRSFPLLIKLIDAKENLSIQVHPDDEYALEHENEYGKSEMWYIIDCTDNAYIYCGFKRDVTREEVIEHIENDTLLELLNKIKVEKGKTYFIPAGTIHAIGEGNLICEVQQNCNSTYRVYDFNRKDKFGNLRKLDVEKALDVLDYHRYTGSDISECKYFECQHTDCIGQAEIEVTEESFVSVMMLSGSGIISCEEKNLSLQKGDCIFIPKRNAKMTIEGKCSFLCVRI
ncbi:MAG: cupin domain-containing protein [Lachnospiraceae bacterium]|nr:cupin domain-containing protein [Lachnospiraceae bacterium]